VSGPWWGREASAAAHAGRQGAVPELLPADRARLLAVLDARIAGFTPEWTTRGPDDAGMALRQLFGEQLEAIAQRLDRWPEKALRAFLDGAGIDQMPGAAAEAPLAFEVADTAPRSVLVAPGFQAGARLDGVDQMVIFETERALYAAPGALGEVFVADRGSFSAVDPDQPFEPFDDIPSSPRSLLIGLTAPAAPTVTLTFGIGIMPSPGMPPPVSAGGVAPLPVPPSPVLVWEILDGGEIVALDVFRDETAGLARSGLVELALPARWRPGMPAGLGTAKSVRWLRLRIAYGRFTTPPSLSYIKLNIARALGASTIRDEVPTPVGASGGRQYQLSQTPVVPGSLLLDVDDSGLQPGSLVRWNPVPDISAAGPGDLVYEIDAVTGVLTFGDGLHGAALPEGFRNVHATVYQVQSPVPDDVPAEAISVAVTPLEFITKVSNPLPASGGGPGETIAQALQRGPLEIRTRGRAVTPADFALLALRATGARIARAFAVPGLHAGFPGAPIPGVVGLIVVPPDLGDGAPMPDQETLRGVATSLTESAALAGIEVVAAAPVYHDVSVEVGILLSDGADAAASAVLLTLNTYLHPLTGGEDGAGWPFGGPIRFSRLLRRVADVPGVRAVPQLHIVLDGLRQPTCQDVSIPPNTLLWPSNHQILLLEAGGAT
jgi:predicted phage baseplate assembly protein